MSWVSSSGSVRPCAGPTVRAGAPREAFGRRWAAGTATHMALAWGTARVTLPCCGGTTHHPAWGEQPDNLSATRVGVVAVSGDTQERAESSAAEWKLSRLRVACGQDVASVRAWGLFASKGIKDPEPEMFGEPGIFHIQLDGTVYMAALDSMPAARPRIDDVVQAIEFFIQRDYPPRGEA